MSTRRSRPMPFAAAAALAAALALAGCASVDRAAPLADVTPFSAQRPGGDGASPWQPWIVGPAKTPTQYEFVVDAASQRVVLQALATRAASGLRQRLDVDPAQRPVVAWEWRLAHPNPAANLADRHHDDSPARVLLFFDGDAATLPLRERLLMDKAALLTGQAVPFATLVYAWDNRLPEGSVVPHAVTAQVKTVVVARGADAAGRWQRFERDYVADYRRAFGAEPGRLIGVGVLTDSDNTKSDALAWYGDIRLLPARATASAAANAR
ncbi:DUF3047 domain-containing protein [Azohydromonas sediminis]|uniref:DUF3047 domain-containing protein n=1 Tax=Azohydromonas sediminis TaxID=2259674 RepID=UPI0013C2C255|nr:DUF3047 domain-containing protein [Azohydromonas sediminis]